MMQRPVNADVSTVKTAFSGSAPLPVELFHRFEKAAGITLVEGYGLTEATCLVSCNPVDGEKKIGSVGIAFPHCDVRILKQTPEGPIDCEVDEVGEICVDNPGVLEGATYTEGAKNQELYQFRPVSQDRRSGPHRCGWLHLDHRPREGPDHPGRPQYRPRRDRGGSGGPRCRGISPARSVSLTPSRANCHAFTWSWWTVLMQRSKS